MLIVHRLVIVIALLGAGLMWLLTGGFNPHPSAAADRTVLLFALPGILGAVLVYPIAWIAAGFRRT
jgi:hypothetical protein